MPAGIPLDHFHRWGCDGKRLLHGISIDCNKEGVRLCQRKFSRPLGRRESILALSVKSFGFASSPFGELANECEPERVQHAESKQVAPPQRRAFAESSAVNAVSLYDPICEKAIQENPQIFLNCNYKINFPLNMPRARRRAFKIVPA